MGVVQITHEVDLEDVEGFFDEVLRRDRVGRELADVLDETARIGEQSAEMYAPTGVTRKLRRHISHERAVRVGAHAWESRFGIELMPDEEDPERGKYPHTGTGVHGPHKTPIEPRAGRFMVFDYRGRRFVLPMVQGQEPQGFIRDAYRDVREYLPQRLHLMARRIAGDR